MSSEGRKRLLLGVLTVVLAVTLYQTWPRSVSTVVSQANANRPANGLAGQTQRDATGLNLGALSVERPKPVAVSRNLFRFAEARPAADRVSAPLPRKVAAQPSPAPPRAVIAQVSLELIGIVETPGQTERVAVLSDERGVYHGREGDIIEGRYRILRITTESVEVSRIDSDTRHVIRLSGTTVP